ncbi:transcriptional regulator, partial [Candidatus Saccharibacteria bacterium]|nr:transcriptional regulator [Candidatus Saccharibacteria bacterium]
MREITRLVDEQINSVRRELSNMLSIGIITSDNSDNKLYYEVNQRYEHYVALRAIFADQIATPVVASSSQSGTVDDTWVNSVKNLPGLRVAVAAGMLVKD